VADEELDRSSVRTSSGAPGWWVKTRRRLATPAIGVVMIGAALGVGGEEAGRRAFAPGPTTKPSAAMVVDKGVNRTGSVFARSVKAYPVPGFDFVDEEGNLYTCVRPTSTAAPSRVIRYFEWKNKETRCYRLAQPEEQPHTHQEPSAPPPPGGATTQRFP
jgi:hypothetical protein